MELTYVHVHCTCRWYFAATATMKIENKVDCCLERVAIGLGVVLNVMSVGLDGDKCRRLPAPLSHCRVDRSFVATPAPAARQSELSV